MSELAKRIAGLSPEKRDLLLQQLHGRRKDERPAGTALPRMQPAPEQRDLPFPLTDIQQVYWTGRTGLFDLGTCGSNVYMEYAITFEAEAIRPAFLDRFQAALQRLIQRHDMLRAIILPDGRQRILPAVPPYSVQVIDLHGLERPRVEAELAAVRERMRSQKAPIDRWPLFEFLAHLLDDRRLQLHIRLDSLLLDGTSRRMLMEELFRLLAAPDLALPALEYTYRDYAVAWVAFQESDRYRRAREYHLRRLPALPPAPALPLAQDISPATPSRFVTRMVSLLAPEAWARLKARAAQADLTPSGVAIAAFVEILAAWSRQPRFTFSLVGSYRPPIHPHIADILGNFNTFHLAAIEDRSGNFEERARRLHGQLTDDLDHLYFSGPQMLREFNRLHRSGSRATMPILFNSVIEYRHPNYQRLGEGGGAATGMLGVYQEVELGVYLPQVLLMPSVMELATGSLECKWDAVDAAFPKGLMQEMLHGYQYLMQRLATDEASWRAATLLPPAQARLPQRNGIGTAYLGGAEEPNQGASAPAFVAPRDELEQQIARIWKELLGVQPIGSADDFFQLGGSSLLVVRLMARLHECFGQDIRLASFLEEATIGHLADLVRRRSQRLFEKGEFERDGPQEPLPTILASEG